MSTYISPAAVTNGLIFYVDSANTSKSWKGKPTTNLNPTATLVGLGLTYTYVSTGSDGYQKYSISGTWTGGSYPYSVAISATNFSAGLSYCTSCNMYVNCPQKFNQSNFGQINYVNDPNMINGGTSNLSGTYSARVGFVYSLLTPQMGYFVSMPIANNTVFDPSTDFMYVKNIQIEQNTFPTPYGTRSTSQALVDMIGSSTLTANGLNYNSDGSFSFGPSNTVTGTLTGSASSMAYTRIAWFNASSIISDFKTIIGNVVGNNSDMALAVANGKVIFHQYTSTADLNISGATTISTNKIYMGAITVDRSGSTNNVNIYVNGVLDGTGSVTLGGSVSDSISIGGPASDSYGGNRMFDGYIYTAMHYNRVLTAAEIMQTFMAHRGRYGV
jgi:hypothetical protein